MLRASYWQYGRHQEKQIYIKKLSQRVEEPIMAISQMIKSIAEPGAEKLYQAESFDNYIFRRVEVEGVYLYQQEFLLRNRRFQGFPGVHVITPLKIKDSQESILVSRGFIPQKLSTREHRIKFQKEIGETKIVGLIKEDSPRKFLAPRDPQVGAGRAWVDAWLRVDITQIQKQLPYKVLPIYLETIERPDAKGIEAEIVNSSSGKDEMLFLGASNSAIKSDSQIPDLNYPVPVFDTVIPPGRHKGYIYEWAFMAVMTLLIGVVLQLRRPNRKNAE
jgi:surfeit locus 1 family protein